MFSTFYEMAMTWVLAILYVCVMLIAMFFTAIFIKYIKSKPLNSIQVREQSLVDLAFLSGLLIVYLSFVPALRLLIGPFENEFLVAFLMSHWIFLFYIILASIASLQLFQVLNICHLSALSELLEKQILVLNRLFVFGLSLCSFGLFRCLNGSFVVLTPLYYLLLNDHFDPNNSVQHLPLVVTLALFVFFIGGCQAVVEVKRFLIKKEDERANQLAISAHRQLEEARNKVNLQPFSNNVALNVNISWQHFRGDDYASNHSSHNIPNDGFPQSIFFIQNLDNNGFARISKINKVVEFARFVCTFGIFPSAVLIILLLFQSQKSLGGHGIHLFGLYFLGGVLPLIIIMKKPKLKLFIKKYIKNLLQNVAP